MSKVKLFEELHSDEFKTIAYRKRHIFVLKNNSVIDSENIKDFVEDTIKLTKMVKDLGLRIPLKIKGLNQFSTVLQCYKSDYLLEKGYEFTESKTYFSKYNEQRIGNNSREKLIDNFRYVILRTYNLADANFFPFGVVLERDDFMFEAYDRSNLTEFCAKNLSRYMNQSFVNLSDSEFKKLLKENIDSINKLELTEVLSEIKNNFSNSFPVELESLMERIKKDAAKSEYNIFDIIGEDGIQSIFDEVNNFTVLIGHNEVISSELVCLNNKNNNWLTINFSYQNILTNTGIAFTTIAKRLLNSDSYDNIKSYFNTLIDRAPEHILIPFIAYDMFNVNKPITPQKFAELAFLIEGHDDGINGIINYYKSLTTNPDFKFHLVDSFYSDEVATEVRSFEKKLKRLKKVIKGLQAKKNIPINHEVKQLQASKIDDLVSPKFGFNLFAMMALIFAKDEKTLKNSSDNVVKAVKLFYDKFFGKEVFTVSDTKLEYKIIDPAFLKMLTLSDMGGDSKSHSGRGVYFNKSKLNEYTEEYKSFVSNIGTNDYRVDSEIESMKSVTKVTELIWWEKLPNGKFEYVGYDSDGKIGNASWDHLINDTHENGVIRALGCNSAEGAMDKVITKPSDWYFHIAELQTTKPYIKQHGDEDTSTSVKLTLKRYAKYLSENGK